jgi:hypothetical protein
MISFERDGGRDAWADAGWPGIEFKSASTASPRFLALTHLGQSDRTTTQLSTSFERTQIDAESRKFHFAVIEKRARAAFNNFSFYRSLHAFLPIVFHEL